MSPRERVAVAIEDVAEDQHLAGTEDVGRPPIEGAPIERQPQIAFALRRETADRRSVEREVVVRPQQELLVVVEHVQAAFEIAEEHGHRLDARLVGEIPQALLLQRAQRHALLALSLGAQVELLELGVGQHQEIAQIGAGGHRRRIHRRGFSLTWRCYLARRLHNRARPPLDNR